MPHHRTRKLNTWAGWWIDIFSLSGPLPVVSGHYPFSFKFFFCPLEIPAIRSLQTQQLIVIVLFKVTPPTYIGIFKKIKIIPKTGHRLESRLRIFWKFPLLPVRSVASFCENIRGSRKFYLLLQFSRYRDAVCGIIRTTKLATADFWIFAPKNF